MNQHNERKENLRREWWLTTIVAFGFIAWLIFGELVRPMGNVLYDHLMRLQGFTPTHNIVIVSIDDRSIQELGGWPLQRSQYTKLLEQLDEDCCRPKALGIDLLFLDPSTEDIRLAAQIKKHNTVLPLAFKVQEENPASLQAVLPVYPLNEAATLGHINLSFDSDGVIRGVQSREQNWQHFSLALQSVNSEKSSSTDAHIEYRRFRMVDPRIGFPMISFADAINSHISRTLLKDKYVLLGVTAPSLGDRYPTLYSGKNNASTPGVAILASVLNASLNHALIDEAPPWTLFAWSLLPLLVMLQSLVLLRPRQVLALAALMILSAVATSYALLAFNNYWIDPVPFVVVTVLLQPLWAWRRLEAIVHFVQHKVADLQQMHPNARVDKTMSTSREVVLQHAKLLDRAVNSARSELGFLSAVIDEIPDAVLIFDVQNQLLLRNQKVEHLFKGQLEQINNIQQLLLHLQLSDDVSTSNLLNQQKVLQASTAQGLRDFVLKTTILNSPIGNDLRLFVLIDITELRQSQKQRDRALQFLSHDMRTPIASILSLTRPIGDASAVPLQNVKITSHAKALLQMMDDFILAISAEASEYKVQMESLDNLINDSLEQVADVAQESAVSLQDATQVSDTFVMVNARLVVRALVNLLFNAIKFSPSQSTVHIHSQHSPKTTTSNACVTITLSNHVARQTPHSDRASTMPGFGIGLDFVENVIHKHQGHIVRHIPDHGIATVQLTLPCEISPPDNS